MIDVLPFPHITAKDTKDQIKQINDYLVYFRETLEFILMNISADNLSSDLINKFNAIGIDIKSSNSGREEETQQIANRIITASDVISSEEYKASIKELEDKLYEKIQEVDDRLTEEIKDVDASIPTSSEIMDDIIDEMQANLETGELEYKQ